MKLKSIFLLCVIVMFCVSLVTAQLVTMKTPSRSVTARLSLVVDVFNRHGIPLPPKLQAAFDEYTAASTTTSEAITSQ